MAVGYRSIFSLRHGQDAVRLTAEQFRSWLALRGYGSVPVGPGVHEVAGHAQLVGGKNYITPSGLQRLNDERLATLFEQIATEVRAR